MSHTIALVRHGTVAVRRAGGLSRNDFMRFIVAYDAAPLRDGTCPPPPLAARVRQTRTVFTSSLRRTADSLRLLWPDSSAVADSLFDEEPHCCVPHLPGRVPLFLWFTVSRCLGVAKPALLHGMRARADAAAERLIGSSAHRLIGSSAQRRPVRWR